MRVIVENEFWQSFINSTVTTPAPEIMLLLIVTVICLVARWTRVGLLIAFIYAYRWGWLFMHQEFSRHQGMLLIYYITGIVAIVGTIIAFLMQKE